MMNYIGIDLGTTNSAICSYDGENVSLYKSPEQNDITPSAIFIDRRGNKYVGRIAYDNASRNPDNAATLFKRMMGTSTPIKFTAINLTMTPEQCSAEILRTLFGYLPETIRNDENRGTVITVPAAFNQMQKDATMEAAKSAGLGRVALMQEPVAAVMSIMRRRKADGIFLIYDLGGGTLDIAIAQSIGGRVSLLSQGGISVCGGRDFDRLLLENVVTPWIATKFDLPATFVSDPKYKPLMRMAAWATERAKIELSSKKDAVVTATEAELGIRDQSGVELYLDIPLTRQQLDTLVIPKLDESIEAAQETIHKAGLTANDIERIVFVGGPTNYTPLRERVASGIGVAPSTEVNPMTAVAEGAAIFAESIDWSSHTRTRKSSKGSIRTGDGTLQVAISYVARSPEQKSKIGIKPISTTSDGTTVQLDNQDTGWSSGRIDLGAGIILDVPLPKPGDNTFKLFLFDTMGRPVSLQEDRIVIARTAATVDAIPASHSIGIEARETIGSNPTLEYIIRQGDPLPRTGSIAFKAGESLRAGSTGSLKFIVREGEITHPVQDNRLIGLFEITGNDFSDGVIAAGAELRCNYTVFDSGNIVLEVSVPSIGANFRSRNFYSRTGAGAGVDYTKASTMVIQDARQTLDRLREIEARGVQDPLIEKARTRLVRASDIRKDESDPEIAKEAMDDIQKAKDLLAQARKANLKTIRQMELDQTVSMFNEAIRSFARPTEATTFDNLAKSAQRSIDENRHEFEVQAEQMRVKTFMILFRQDWFVVDMFKSHLEAPHLFANAGLQEELTQRGQRALNENDMDELRKTLIEMDANRIASPEVHEFLAVTNIMRAR